MASLDDMTVRITVTSNLITMGKKYTTRDGRAVRILATDVKHLPFPVVGTIVYANESEGNFQWTANGSYYPEENHISDLDLIPVPTKHEGYAVELNGYARRFDVYMTRHAAEICGIAGRIIPVTWED